MSSISKKGIIVGITTFLLVLLLIPFGHALMVLNEYLFSTNKLISAGVIGFIGIFLLLIGLIKSNKRNLSSMLGFLAATLVWTGWIEFSFVWVAEKNNVQHYVVDGVIRTRAEYLIMLSTTGLMGFVNVFYLFTKNRCKFFMFFQKYLKLDPIIKPQKASQKPPAMVTFNETICIIWCFYIALLLLYDESIFGEKHLVTIISFFFFIGWSIYLLIQHIKIIDFDQSLRYGIPTALVLWNTIELAGRWNWLSEFWIYPKENPLLIMGLLIGLFILIIIGIKIKKQKTTT